MNRALRDVEAHLTRLKTRSGYEYDKTAGIGELAACDPGDIAVGYKVVPGDSGTAHNLFNKTPPANIVSSISVKCIRMEFTP
jgi:hypothetical protein